MNQDNLSREELILRSLRQIIRAIDRHSRKLRRLFNLTVPQIVCLQQLREQGDLTAGDLAQAACLSQPTITGIIDRLEKRGLVNRLRGARDRRRVFISLSEEGREIVAIMPKPLQDQFLTRLAELPEAEQTTVAETLAMIVDMMSAGDLEASPILTLNDLPVNDLTADH